jgi:hypothetical protein
MTIIKNSVISICIIILVFIYIPGSSSAYERPEYKDGIGANWHPAKMCLPCHYMLAGTVKARTISYSCQNCHIYKGLGPNKLNMSKIEDIHVDIVCIECHIGQKSQINVTAADFHRVMSKTACLSCHTVENGTYKKPLKKKCSDCHSGSPHVVHGNKIEKMCVACHGEFGEQYVNQSIPQENKMKSPSISNISSIYGTDKSEYPTIGQLIINLIEKLSQI